MKTMINENTELSRKELDQQDFIDNSIMELINTVNPSSEEIKYSGNIVGKIRDTLIEIFTGDLGLCTEQDFYPYRDQPCTNAMKAD